MEKQRGWIRTRDGQTYPVPPDLLEEEEITWPPTFPEKKAGQPVKYLGPDDFYRRHEIIEGEAFLYLPHELALDNIAGEEIERLLEGE